jgi:hypothetical protein
LVRADVHAPRIPGDLDGDDAVGSGDLDIVRANWGDTVTPGDLMSGDANGDGVVNSGDLNLVRANWGNRASAVPEPGVALLVLLGACFLFTSISSNCRMK